MTKYSKGDGKVDSEKKMGKQHMFQLPEPMDHELKGFLNPSGDVIQGKEGSLNHRTACWMGP